MSTGSTERTGPLQTVDRALDVLLSFDEYRTSWGVLELAAEFDLSKSTAQRLLASLAGKGFLRADPDTRRYSMGPAMWRMAGLWERSGGLSSLAGRRARPLHRGGWRQRGAAPVAPVRGRALPGPRRRDLPRLLRLPGPRRAARPAVRPALGPLLRPHAVRRARGGGPLRRGRRAGPRRLPGGVRRRLARAGRPGLRRQAAGRLAHPGGEQELRARRRPDGPPRRAARFR